MGPHLVFSYKKIMRPNGRKVSQIFLTIITRQLGSILASIVGNRGPKCRYSVFCDILGRKKYSGRVLPKIPYSTIAVKFFDTAYNSDTYLRQEEIQGLLIEGYDSDTEVVKIGREIARLRLGILHQCNLVRDYLPRVHNNHKIRNRHLVNKPPDLNRRQIQDLIANNFCMGIGVQKISLKFFLTRQPICYKFEDRTNFI